MALFAFRRDTGADLHDRIADEAHVVPERIWRCTLGGWRLSAFATATHYYPAEAQVWIDGVVGEACVIHGIVWRIEGGGATLLDAAGVAALTARPGEALPEGIAGEFAVARLHRDGTLEAFADPAGLHQIFHRADEGVANRAAFLADDRAADPEAGLWTTAIGYRVGNATGWRGVRQLPPGCAWRDGEIVVAGSPDLRGSVLRRRPESRTVGGALRILGSGLRRSIAALRGIFRADRADPPEPRGFDPALADAGIAEAVAVLRAAVGEAGAIPLPITGGKDSRVVLVLCLAAGLRDRLDLFTRGAKDHPDVVVGQSIADRLGLPHRREPPLGAADATDWSLDRFVAEMARLAFQTDGNMGGWDLVTARAPGRETLITGHMGEMLKAYAKRPPEGALDPVALVRLQAPFDPLGILRPHATARLASALAAQMEAWRADPADLPDLFYLRNRVPNWLGGIRGVKSFERQPVMPLGVPSLMRLAAHMTAQERAEERAHWHIVAKLAPDLLDIPFAHQSWKTPGAPTPDPVLALAGSALFGNWQYSLNRNPAIRPWLADFFARTEVALWEDVDRDAVVERLRTRSFDYFDAISLLGLTVAVFHASGLVRCDRIGAEWPDPEAILVAALPEIVGHLDGVSGAADVGEGHIRPHASGLIAIGGWLFAKDWDGAQPRVEAWLGDRLVGTAASDRPRPDLEAAGIVRGAHGFSLSLNADALAGGGTLRLTGFGGHGTVATMEVTA